MMCSLLLPATSLLAHLSWGLPAAFPTQLQPPCLPFPTTFLTAPTTVGKLKWQRKAPPGLFFSEVPPPGKRSPSFPRSSLVLYKGTNHRTGNKQIKATTAHHGENEGLAERPALPARGVNDVSPAACLLSSPTSAGDTKQKPTHECIKAHPTRAC